VDAALIGRARERDAIERALTELPSQPVFVIAGEPGIGKSRLLAHLAARAAAGGCAVREAHASEFESDLPYGLWAEALGRMPDGTGPDRHGRHRALRESLEELAGADPLVLCLDDVHWADPASADALAALVHRPPAAPVMLALAGRAGRFPITLAAAIDAATRAGRVTALELAPLSEAEAAELIGQAAAAVYDQAGGNPFYLEQLARVRGVPNPGASGDGAVPPAIAAALTAELALLSPESRALLDAAAVAGDPFEPRLAGVVAELTEPAALRALDELLLGALVRPAGAPRSFAFRHPIVRHAVYMASPAGWRLGAHARAAAELERRGAGPLERAHHVEHAAHPGDADAIALLAAAGDGLRALAPASAARFHAAALRLLPDGSDRRTAMQAQLADAQAAAGAPLEARATLLAALQTAAPEDRLGLTVAVANQETLLGEHEEARRRLHVALADLPAEPSPDRVRLRLALCLAALTACDFADARAHGSDGLADARAIADPVTEAATLAGLALAAALDADRAAGDRLAEAATALERLTPQQLATRLFALWMVGRAQRALGRFDAALASLERTATIATETGRERFRLVASVESVPVLIELGRLAEASAAAEEGLELARLAASESMLLWAHSALAFARLAAGDVAAALRYAGDAARIDAPRDTYTAGQPGWCTGAALVAAGNADGAVEAMLEGFGGPGLKLVLPADRPMAAADLVEAQLARDDLDAAERALAAAGDDLAAVTGVARAALLLARGDPDAAIDAAVAARETGAPLVAARARLVEGRALAAAGRRPEAVDALRDAEARFDQFGAERRRSEAVRELRRLGHRVLRPARDPATGRLAPLTAREREIADLVAAGRTNREIAEQLVLSTRTIEAHLRNIYGKLGVRSRVELTRIAS
jgi:DNA-binding NarL/FixJ family response regulator